jgi:hypothetical protein
MRSRFAQQSQEWHPRLAIGFHYLLSTFDLGNEKHVVIIGRNLLTQLNPIMPAIVRAIWSPASR